MHIVIVGGGRIGVFLAKRLLKEKNSIVIIEKDEEIAQKIAGEIDNAMVLCGDGCDPNILEQAEVVRAEVVVAVSGFDEQNFIVCQIAKEQFKVKRTIARVNDPENERAFNELGIDVPIGATMILGKIIEEEASFEDFVDLFSFKRGKLALIRVDLPETSPLIDKKLQELELPSNCVLVSIMRKDEIIIPKGDTVLKPLDDVVALTTIEQKQKLLNYLIGKI